MAATATGGRAGGMRWRTYAILIVVLVVALGGIDLLALALGNPTGRLSHHDYLALGDSLAYGYQPDLNFSDGYVDDVFRDVQHANVTAVVNYACGGESTATMIAGGCTGHVLKHDPYFGAQLDAAVSFLKAHHGAVSPITLDIGANDVMSDFDQATCSVGSGFQAALATMDGNLTGTILPRLLAALHAPAGLASGQFVMLNYYNPYVRECANSMPFIDTLNAHLAADAARFEIPIADVYGAFGGDAHQADHICDYTWICNAQFHDIHPTIAGYAVIAQTVERVLSIPGIGPGANPLSPLPQLGPLGALPPTMRRA